MNENNRILIVDDDPGVRDSYQEILAPIDAGNLLSEVANLFGDSPQETPPLQHIAYELTLAARGEEGISAVTAAVERGTPFAVTFLDMKMPGIDGAETARRIWAIDPNVKIVIVTAYAEHRPEEIISITGREDLFYLRKPFNRDEIRQFARVLVTQWSLEREVERRRQRLENIIEATRLGTWEWDVQSGETTFNERWADIVGYTLEELQPVSIETWVQLAHPDDLQESNELLQKHFARETEYYEYESRMKHKSGKWVWVSDRGKVIEWTADGQPRQMFGTHTDITEKKELAEKIRQVSIRDPLTKLYNRRYIFERFEGILAEHLREKNTFSVSIVDIDHFKSINDTYGHQAGDYILAEFANIFQRNIRPYDLLGRYGGEEFIIVSIHAHKECAVSQVERISEEIRAKVFRYHDIEITLTFSCGIADSSEYSDEAISIENIVNMADKRLYKAKETGRNRIITS